MFDDGNGYEFAIKEAKKLIEELGINPNDINNPADRGSHSPGNIYRCSINQTGQEGHYQIVITKIIAKRDIKSKVEWTVKDETLTSNSD